MGKIIVNIIICLTFFSCNVLSHVPSLKCFIIKHVNSELSIQNSSSGRCLPGDKNCQKEKEPKCNLITYSVFQENCKCNRNAPIDDVIIKEYKYKPFSSNETSDFRCSLPFYGQITYFDQKSSYFRGLNPLISSTVLLL
jgi:hypothetical protein